jgi:hypothetical protein
MRHGRLSPLTPQDDEHREDADTGGNDESQEDLWLLHRATPVGWSRAPGARARRLL